MKKVFISILLVILCIGVVFTICSCREPIATEFNSKPIENSMYNYRAGGNLAYNDNGLYVIINSGTYNLGAYKITDGNKSENVFVSNNLKYIYEVPKLYTYNNELYSYELDSVIKKFDNKIKGFVEFENSVVPYRDMFYMTDDLLVYYRSYERLKYKWKDKTYKIKDEVSDFFVDGNNIYYFTRLQALKKISIDKGETEGEFVADIFEYGGSEESIFCNGEYYFEGENNDNKMVLYKYSLKENKTEIVAEPPGIICMNCYDNNVYMATEKGVYCYNGVECERISKIKAEEIYILDEDWIYTYNKDLFKVYRMNHDGENVEKINFKIK